MATAVPAVSAPVMGSMVKAGTLLPAALVTSRSRSVGFTATARGPPLLGTVALSVNAPALECSAALRRDWGRETSLTAHPLG